MIKLILLIFVIVYGIVWGQEGNPPPAKPLVGAAVGDRSVTLYWDEQPENAEDFEGYIILRSTEPTFKEVQTITDGFGNPIFYKPIAQFDKDNDLEGPHPVPVNGIKFFIGENTGLVHTWTDSGQVPGFPIRNGQIYFYAVCSYDQGDTSLSLPPSMSNIDTNFNFVYDDSNTVTVTPNAPAAGYFPPEIITDKISKNAMVYVEYVNSDNNEVVDYGYSVHYGDFLCPSRGPGTGNISIRILDPSKVKNNHEYQIVFQDTGYFHQTVSYSVYDATYKDTLIKDSEYIQSKDLQEGLILGNKFEPTGPIMEYRKWGPTFDGMSIQIFNHPQVSYIDSLSGWIVGACNYESHVEFVGQHTVRIIYPADYEIRLFDHVVDSSVNGSIPTNFQVWNVTDDSKSDFRFEDRDNDLTLSLGDNIYPIIYVDSNIKYPWKISFLKHISPLNGNYLELDGGGDYAMATDNPSLDVGDESQESLTVEAWIYPRSLGEVIVADDGYALVTVPHGIGFRVKGEELLHSIIMTDVNFQTNRWHHVVGIFDNVTNKLAVGFDGNILWSNEDTTTFNLDNIDSPLYIGSLDDIQGFFNGAIDEVRISDIVRYSGAVYNPDSIYTPDTHTRGLWHFNEITDSSSFMMDSSGYENTLTAQGNARVGPPIPIPPEAGDVFLVHCTKPFRSWWINNIGDTLAGDIFQFVTRAAYSDKTRAKMQLDDIAVVPNPYPGVASWESNSDFGEGGRKIYFIHLPPKATIRIYTISGYLVDKIEHQSQINNGAEPWDLRSKDGREIAYGIYIYHVDAPGVGEKIGKFAVIK